MTGTISFILQRSKCRNRKVPGPHSLQQTATNHQGRLEAEAVTVAQGPQVHRWEVEESDLKPVPADPRLSLSPHLLTQA